MTEEILKPCPFCSGDCLAYDDCGKPAVPECLYTGAAKWDDRPVEDALRVEIDRLNASVNYLLERIRLTEKVEQVNDDLRRRNIDLEATIASLRAELNQKNLDVFGGG